MRDKFLLISVFVLLSVSMGSAVQEYGISQDSGSNFEAQDWFEAPTYDSQSELLFEILAPFAFMTILLQMTLKKTLRMTFAQEDDNPWTGENKPKVHKESTLMAVTISAMLLASPYWTLIRQMAASIGVLTVGLLGLLLLYLGYLFIKG
jgi:hypothetical protein